ncbi:hypothetical protein D7B24_004338 [Verticillium nonalfalfae]|uniref:Uncharacterized protein n=1 Tax=Verticillium nonalfalfae TaxID=1051616 RepID=A0A3M9YDR7_9PEZI|nr:uncharacterized protein D7B24_004338 [Verticillium nonalfalfae]RNJ58703.1 hypothetical protein D7B24_004338 [Verticillium nonalfalfae]
MDRTGVVLLALAAVIVTCGPLSCVIFAKIRRHRKSHPGLRQLANARNQLTAVGGCSNSLGAERLAGSGWGTLGDRSTTTASGIGVGVCVGTDGVLVESGTPQGANSSCGLPSGRTAWSRIVYLAVWSSRPNDLLDWGESPRRQKTCQPAGDQTGDAFNPICLGSLSSSDTNIDHQLNTPCPGRKLGLLRKIALGEGVRMTISLPRLFRLSVRNG